MIWHRIFLKLAIVFIITSQCTKSREVNTNLKYIPTPYELNIFEKFPELPVPEDNPLTVEGVELGRMLFYDPILSGDSTQSCSSCHIQEFAFSDNRRFSVGVDNKAGNRNSMPIINSGWYNNFFWDGRANSLEEQALDPVKNPIEMHGSWEIAIKRIKASDIYPSLFDKAFNQTRISKELVVKAIAQFGRTLISDNSKYDKVLRKETSFSEAELRGLNLFFTEKADCFHCHGNILFSDAAFHNSGLDEFPNDYGLEHRTKYRRDRGKFKTPTLRNLVFTAPYMHDGRFSTLEEVIDFYSEGVKDSPTIDPLMKYVERGGVQLSEEEKSDLLAFLMTLTDSTFISNPAFSNPFE